MHLKLFAVAGAAVLMLLAPARADAACCDKAKATHDHACCMKSDPAGNVDVEQVLLSMMEPAEPQRQEVKVWFQRPVLVGRSILQGPYVIEHDNGRMARGEPCTHIYALNDRTRPVVAFHCTHLEREKAATHQVVLETGLDFQKLQEFQFAGETASHGVPAIR